MVARNSSRLRRESPIYSARYAKRKTDQAALLLGAQRPFAPGEVMPAVRTEGTRTDAHQMRTARHGCPRSVILHIRNLHAPQDYSRGSVERRNENARGSTTSRGRRCTPIRGVDQLSSWSHSPLLPARSARPRCVRACRESICCRNGQAAHRTVIPGAGVPITSRSYLEPICGSADVTPSEGTSVPIGSQDPGGKGSNCGRRLCIYAFRRCISAGRRRVWEPARLRLRAARARSGALVYGGTGLRPHRTPSAPRIAARMAARPATIQAISEP